MRGVRAWIGVLAMLWAVPAAGAGLDEALHARILERHTQVVNDTAGTRVDYPALASSAEWRRLVDGLAGADPTPLGREARLAFWINAYNILAIDLVVLGYPVDEIRELGSFFRPVWKRPAGRVGAREVTLDEIEHRILRPMGEPRIHTAIVCASTSCPSLRREPWTAGDLDAQLDDGLRRFLADPDKGFRLDRERETVHLSRIFDWFSEDFDAHGGALAFVKPHLAAADRRWLDRNPGVRVRFFDYDWSLNDIRR